MGYEHPTRGRNRTLRWERPLSCYVTKHIGAASEHLPYIQHDPKDVLFLVPSRSKYNQSLDALLAAVGRDACERTRKAFDASGRPAGYRHVGWRWPCDCTAFARSDGDYLWVPCSRHEPRPQTQSNYAPAERPSYVATNGVPERRTGTA